MEFFAGANSVSGFVSIFDEVFSSVERLFILKGSSGCGKSTLMKRIANCARERGYSCDIIRCSADHNSLDGVIIKELSVAVADGTSPHLLDVKYPCVRENIINLGQFWDERRLLSKKNEIISLTDEKSSCYKGAYKSLSLCGQLEKLKNRVLYEFIDYERLDKLIFSLIKRKSGEGRVKRIFSSSFSADGVITLNSFESVSDLVQIFGECSRIFMNRLWQVLRELSIDCNISMNPIYQIPDAVLIDDMLITDLENPPILSFARLKRINCVRFCKPTESALKLKALNRLQEEFLRDARESLKKAREAHNSLESIFIPCMDFKALDECCDQLISSVFEA